MSKRDRRAVDIVGYGLNWQVVLGGVVVRKNITSYEAACCAARNIEKRHSKRERACMCCGIKFTSTGPGHRLCYDCNARARKMMF